MREGINPVSTGREGRSMAACSKGVVAMMTETTNQMARNPISSISTEEWQRRREAIWEVAVGAKAAELLAVQMRRRAALRLPA
jgi:hypothetical protein